MRWGKLYFDERPKQTKEDLYDFESESHALCAAIERGDPLVVLVGLRRTGGSTSLRPNRLIDGRCPIFTKLFWQLAMSREKHFVLLLLWLLVLLHWRLLSKLLGLHLTQEFGPAVSLNLAAKVPVSRY